MTPYFSKLYCWFLDWTLSDDRDIFDARERLSDIVDKYDADLTIWQAETTLRRYGWYLETMAPIFDEI